MKAKLVAVFLVAIAVAVEASCDCDYHSGGCSISKAPAAGYKCKCKYKGAWTCSGQEFQCNSNQHCPGNCKSQECCNTGGGDCGGY